MKSKDRQFILKSKSVNYSDGAFSDKLCPNLDILKSQSTRTFFIDLTQPCACPKK